MAATKWDEAKIVHLFLSIHSALDLSFTKENKDAIVKMMTERYGHDVTWNGIRSIRFLFGLFPTLPYTLQPFSPTLYHYSPVTAALHCSYQSHILYSLVSSLAYYLHSIIAAPHPVIMSSSRTTMRWNEKVHEDILLVFNDVFQPTRENWDRIMAGLQGMGYTFSESALK
ncbi:hypothetical protein NUW58_g8659 [Xylaria curta]|uniref:Uncharacterized protein n=1 Tax=Xylaria curta TaxID=42375 RepID=A0ACC1N5B3_9PEZI|nr:hypothetical protein NUW58_g8659 [Xylaria curta]